MGDCRGVGRSSYLVGRNFVYGVNAERRGFRAKELSTKEGRLLWPTSAGPM